MPVIQRLLCLSIFSPPLTVDCAFEVFTFSAHTVATRNSTAECWRIWGRDSVDETRNARYVSPHEVIHRVHGECMRTTWGVHKKYMKLHQLGTPYRSVIPWRTAVHPYQEGFPLDGPKLLRYLLSPSTKQILHKHLNTGNRSLRTSAISSFSHTTLKQISARPLSDPLHALSSSATAMQATLS